MEGDGEESEGAQLKRGYCLHIKTLPLTPRKSSNLPCKVLQFNFSIVLRDNPLITEEEVALSPGQRVRAHREPLSTSLDLDFSLPLRRGHFACSLALVGCLGARQLALRSK